MAGLVGSPPTADYRPPLVSGFDHLVLRLRPYFFVGVVVAIVADSLATLFDSSLFPVTSAAEVALAIGTLALAYAALLQLASSVESRREEAEWRQQLRAEREREDRRANRSEYRRHGIWLNQAVFQHLPSIGLQRELTIPQAPEGSGIVVDWPSNERLLVEGLPNWPEAVQHLSSDSRLKQSLESVKESSFAYYQHRSEEITQFVEKLSELVVAEYGSGMRVKNIWEAQTPPWCDVQRLAWISLTQAENPDWLNQPLFTSPSQPFVSLGSFQLLWGVTAAENDPSRLQRVWDQVRTDAEQVARMKKVVDFYHETKRSISAFSEQARHYSNRLALTEDFEGECDECSSRWKPR